MSDDRYRLARVASAAVCEQRAFSKAYEERVAEIRAGITFCIEAEALAPRSIAARWEERADPEERAIIREWVRLLRAARGRNR